MVKATRNASEAAVRLRGVAEKTSPQNDRDNEAPPSVAQVNLWSVRRNPVPWLRQPVVNVATTYVVQP